MFYLIQILLLVFGILAVVSFLITFFWGLYLHYDSGFDRDLIKKITDNPYFGYSLVITVISFIMIFSLGNAKTRIYRENTNQFFRSFDKSKDQLLLNNILMKNDSLVLLLKSIKKESTSRNTGKTEINIKIIKNNSPKYILLLRDFSDSKKYWVYLKDSELDKDGYCIGEINTCQFDTIDRVK